MLSSVFPRQRNWLFIFFLTISLLNVQPAISQQSSTHTADTLKSINDSLLPSLVIKVAAYTATIDHTEFMLRRKFKITPITLDLPDIERRLKGFKSRLEKRGSQMNLRSLNSGVIILKEVSDNLASYQNILNSYSSELTKSNAEVKKIIHDPALNTVVSDSILMEQLEDIRTEGLSLDSLQQKTLTKVNLL